MSEENVKASGEESITSLVQQVSRDAIVAWSDDKRREFVGTFTNRVKASQYIYLITGKRLLKKAQERQFISIRQYEEAKAKAAGLPVESLIDKKPGDACYYSGYEELREAAIVGSRPVAELNTIIDQRCEEIIKSLPHLKKAVEIISPETAKLISTRDRLTEEANVIVQELEVLCADLDIDDLDESMSLKDFKQLARDRYEKREDLKAQLAKLGERTKELQIKIDKFLYSGIPGLSDAIVEVAVSNFEHALGLGHKLPGGWKKKSCTAILTPPLAFSKALKKTKSRFQTPSSISSTLLWKLSKYRPKPGQRRPRNELPATIRRQEACLAGLLYTISIRRQLYCLHDPEV